MVSDETKKNIVEFLSSCIPGPVTVLFLNDYPESSQIVSLTNMNSEVECEFLEAYLSEDNEEIGFIRAGDSNVQ